MPNDPKKSGGGADDDDAEGEERPTAAPPFDPIAFAREVFDDDDGPFGPADKPFTPPTVKPRAPSKQPAEAQSSKPPAKDETPTAPPKAPEALPRFDSAPAEPPPAPIRSPAMKRKATPTGALSLANQRVPTVPPPTRRPQDVQQPFQSKKPSGRTSARGQEINDVPELDTSPPPGGRSAEEHARSQQANADGPPTEQEMNDRVSLGDYTGALAIAERLLETDPSNSAVNECAESCRNVLRQMYTARIGPLDKVPIVMVPRDQLRWLSIDHKAGFVLSLVDGVSSVEMILDVSGMQELDALRILSELAQQRIISFR